MKKWPFYIIGFISFLNYGQQTLLDQAEEHLYTHQDSAYFYLDILYEKSMKNKEWVNALEALTYSNVTSIYHKNLMKFKSSLQKEDSLFLKIGQSIDSLPNGTYYKHYYWFDKGSYLYNIHDYNNATSFFLKILNSLEELPDSIVKSDYASFHTSSYSYLASMYKNEFKYKIAEEFYKENLGLHKKYNQEMEDIYDTKNLIASLKSVQKDYVSSNKYAKESILYYIDNSPEEHLNSLLSTSLLLINNYIKLNSPDSAKVYLNKIKPYINSRNRFKTDFLELSAKIASLENNHEKAILLYNNAINDSAFTKNRGDDNAILYKNLGDLYQSKGKYKQSLVYYNKAFNMFSSTSSLSNDNNLHLKANSKTNILKIIRALCKTHIGMGTKKNHEQVLKYAFLTVEKMDDLRKGFFNDSDKQVLVENVLPIFENGIEASYTLYTTLQNKAYIDTAFVFFERSKSNILLDALLKNNASIYANIPETLIEKERILKLNISELEKEIDLQEIEEENKLFTLKREHENLIKELETNYPSYFNLKYRTNITSIQQLQKGLNPKECVLSYFYGEKAIYALTITHENKRLHKIPYSKQDKALLMSFQKLLSNPRSNLSKLNKLSYNIYQKLVSPCLEGLKVENLLIIPDGFLQTIPFGAFNTKENSTIYLLEKFSISYVNSATLKSQLQSRNKNNPNLLAFAPNFDISDDFSTLPNNSTEVKHISGFFNGKTLIGKDATLQNFNNQLKNYGIIHLATHAVTNDNIPEYSFLAFTPNKEEEYLMYINDLYAIELNADLVTLSACETGVGELKKGEGSISLARAFFYSGARSLVNTLWNINDKSSSEIMGNFYEKLANGKQKDVALQEAKLGFIKKNKETGLTHPYYWSSFIVQGNTDALIKSTAWVWYMLGVVLFLLLLFLGRKKLVQFFK